MVEPKARVLMEQGFYKRVSVRNKEAPPAPEYEVEQILLEKAL